MGKDDTLPGYGFPALILELMLIMSAVRGAEEEDVDSEKREDETNMDFFVDRITRFFENLVWERGLNGTMICSPDSDEMSDSDPNGLRKVGASERYRELGVRGNAGRGASGFELRTRAAGGGLMTGAGYGGSGSLRNVTVSKFVARDKLADIECR